MPPSGYRTWSRAVAAQPGTAAARISASVVANIDRAARRTGWIGMTRSVGTAQWSHARAGGPRDQEVGAMTDQQGRAEILSSGSSAPADDPRADRWPADGEPAAVLRAERL